MYSLFLFKCFVLSTMSNIQSWKKPLALHFGIYLPNDLLKKFDIIDKTFENKFKIVHYREYKSVIFITN